MLSARSMARAEPREPKGVVAEHRAVGGPVDDEHDALHPVDEPGELLAGHVLRFHAAQFEPGAVDRVPHFHGQGRPDGAGILAGDLDAIADRGRVVRAEGEEVSNRGLAGDVVEALELVKVAGDQNRAFPFVAFAAVARGQRREAQRRVEDPRNEIGALRVARHPVEIVGRAGQHGGLHRYANAPGNWFSHRAPMCPWSPRLGSSSRQANLPSARRV